MKLRIGLFLASAALAVAQTQPQPAPPKQVRDLKIEKIDDAPPVPKAPTIPRSYAVVVGISR